MKHNQDGFGLMVLLVTLLVVAIAGVTGVLIYRLNNDPQKTNSEMTPDTRAIMAVTANGGLCSDGPCAHPVRSLYDNGEFEDSRKLSDSEVTQLKKIINETDFTKYGANSGLSCQSAVDGSDRVLLFPAKYGNKTFTPCMLDIPKDDSAFVYINQLLITHYLQ